MIQILELIKHLGLGIVSVFLFIGITMAEIKNTKDFMAAIEEVRKEYPEDAIEKKIPTSFIATVAAAETGNFKFEGAPTAMKANNYFGLQATGKQDFLTTTGGAKLRNFPDNKASIRSFLSLIANDERYKEVVSSMDNVENMFKGMSPYAEKKDYPSFLANVYTDRIKPIIETENMLVTKVKPLVDQMNTLK